MLQRCLRTSTRRCTIHRYPSVSHTTQWLRYKTTEPHKPDPARKPSYWRTVVVPYIRHIWSSTPCRTFVRFSSYGLTIFLSGHAFFTYILDYGFCHGISMLPTFQAAEDAALISKYYRRGRGIKVGDLISYRNPVNADEEGLKRVLGMEGDFVMRDIPKVDDDGLPTEDGTAKMIQV